VPESWPALRRRLFYCPPELHDRLASDRIDQVGRNRGERLEDEGAFAEARVRHSKAGFVDDFVTCEDEVQIERPRRIRAGPRAAVTLFDGQKRIEELARRARRAADARCVEIEGIVFESGADWRCLDQERQLELREDAADLVSRGENGLASVAKIAAERDRDNAFGFLLPSSGRPPSSVLRPPIMSASSSPLSGCRNGSQQGSGDRGP
jgi:hypothetical protein